MKNSVYKDHRKTGYNSQYGNTSRYNVISYNLKKDLVYKTLTKLPQRYKFGSYKIAEMCNLNPAEVYDYIIRMHIHNELPKDVFMTRSKGGIIQVFRD